MRKEDTDRSGAAHPPPGVTAFSRTIAVLVVLHFIILVLMLTRTLDPLFSDARHRLGPGTDFYAYYNAGKCFLAGEGAYGHGPGFGFRYHPAFAATVLAVLSCFSPDIAYLLWAGIVEISFFSFWYFVFRSLKSRKQCLVASVLLVLFSPYYLDLYMGNASFLVAVLLLWAFRYYRERRVAGAGVLLTVSIIIKPVGLVFIPYLLMRREFRLVVLTLLVVVGSALPFFVADRASLDKFLSINLHAVPAAGWVVHAGNQGFHALVTNLCTRIAGIPTSSALASFSQLPGACRVLLWSITGAVICLSALASWARRNDLGVCAFLWFSAYLLGYKDVWEHTYAVTAVALLWLFLSRCVSYRTVLIGAVWMALPTAFVLYDVALPPGPIDPEHYWSLGVSVLHHATKSCGLLFLYVSVLLGVFLDWRRGKRAADAESEA